MDQTARPATISPEFLLYAEKHDLFDLFQVKKHKNVECLIPFFQRCISSLLIDRPNDPIGYLIDLLKRDSDG